MGKNGIKKEYTPPTIEDLGALAELTLNGFSMGNDIGKGKSGKPRNIGS